MKDTACNYAADFSRLEYIQKTALTNSQVIARIFYCVNRSWSGRITIPELRKSNFLAVLATLDEEEDINQVTDFFSYEHFYVIYCKFWELDKDHDLFIDREDLSRHNDHGRKEHFTELLNWILLEMTNTCMYSFLLMCYLTMTTVLHVSDCFFLLR